MNFREKIPVSEDLNSAEVSQQILEGGDPQKLEELRKFHNLTEEQIKLFSQFAQLRRDTVRQMDNDGIERKKNNPIATDEELDLGTYIENIEPQVRTTVLELRKKGYSTIQSGFYAEESQFVEFEKGVTGQFDFSEALVSELAESGISIELTEEELVLHFKEFISLDKIKEVWEKVINEVPDLGQKALPNVNTQGAISFREEHKK